MEKLSSADDRFSQESLPTNGKSKKSKETAKSDTGDDGKEGGPSYTAMIAQAILSNHLRRATLSEIYEFMANTFDVLKKRGTGWRNCVRHTLSLNECFVKLHRPENGRSCNWTVHPNYFENFLRGDYRKRRMIRKKSRSMPWLEGGGLNYAASLSYMRESEINYRDHDTSRITSASHSSQLWQQYPQSNPFPSPRTSSNMPPSLLPRSQSDERIMRPQSSSPTLPLPNRTRRLTPPPPIPASAPYDFPGISAENLTDFPHIQSSGTQPYPLSTTAAGYSSMHSHLPAYSDMGTNKGMGYNHQLTQPSQYGDKPGSNYPSVLSVDAKSMPYSNMMPADKSVAYSYDGTEQVHTCQPFGTDPNCFACYLSKSAFSNSRAEYFPGI